MAVPTQLNKGIRTRLTGIGIYLFDLGTKLGHELHKLGYIPVAEYGGVDTFDEHRPHIRELLVQRKHVTQRRPVLVLLKVRRHGVKAWHGQACEVHGRHAKKLVCACVCASTKYGSPMS